MSVHFYSALLISLLTLSAGQDLCPNFCNCEIAALSDLPINSVLVNTRFKTDKQDDEPRLPSYQSRNEVLDEAEEQVKERSLGENKLKAATCKLLPENNLLLFLSLPSDLQVLMILHGPSETNITLDESYFEHLQMLVILEIHGFANGQGVLRLRKNALKHLGNLRYINFQHLHLLGDPGTGNQPVPMSEVPFDDSNIKTRAVHFPSHEFEDESNDIPQQVKFIQYQREAEIVPYSIYQKQLERAGFSTFTGLHNLEFLRAYHCNIKELNWEMFMGLERLKYLSLEGNKIPFINDFSFYGTPNLKHLTMSHNHLLGIHSIGLAGLLELEILDLSYNNISHLSELSLPPLPKLVSLDFHHNPLEEVLPYTFIVTNNTQNLFLGGKLAKMDIHQNSFLGLRQLKKLSLTGLFLKVLEREFFKGMHALRELRIQGKIRTLSFDAFAEIPKLQELIMKNCSIKEISMDAFFGLYNLMYLDLSHNELEVLPPSLFDQQESLKEIILSSNRLTTLPENLFLHVPAKLIRLDKNPWHCTCAMNEWKPSQINKIKIKTLDNSLCQTRYDKGSMCMIRYMYQYKYEQSVSPKCASPSRFSGWNVFHLLRKHLRCQDKLNYPKLQQKKEKHLSIKNVITGNSQKVTDENSQLNITTGISASTTQSPKLQSAAGSTAGVETSTELEEATTIEQSDFNHTTNIQTTQTLVSADNRNISMTRVEDNQHMWTKKDKDKYKHFEEKYERTMKKLNTTSAAKTYKVNPQYVNKNTEVPTKKKEQHDEKWEKKVVTTMKHLNTTSENGNEENKIY